jgi:hypothetical protein
MNRTSTLLYLFFLFTLNSCSPAQSGENKKEIKASEILKQINKGNPVQIYDKIIIGTLDFSSVKDKYIVSTSSQQATVKSNIFFFNCVFMDKVTSTGSYTKEKITLKNNTLFEKNVTFSNCDFRGTVNFEDAEIRGKMDFSQSVFRETASFNGITVFGNRNSFTEITAEKNFTMISALIHGNINFMNATFQANSSFQELSANVLQFSNAVFENRADLSNMTIYKNAYFNYVVFKENVLFSFSKYLGDLDFMYNIVEKDIFFSACFLYGKTRLNLTDFRGKSDFSETLFLCPPQQEGVKSIKNLELNVLQSKSIRINEIPPRQKVDTQAND